MKLKYLKYNFYIGGDGEVYDGRGWEMQGRHTLGLIVFYHSINFYKLLNLALGYNDESIGIAFIGISYSRIAPNQTQIDGVLDFLEKAVKAKKLTERYEITAQCKLINTTSCPSASFLKDIEAWSNKTSASEARNSVSHSAHVLILVLLIWMGKILM